MHHTYIIESVDSISRDGLDTPIYVIYTYMQVFFVFEARNGSEKPGK